MGNILNTITSTLRTSSHVLDPIDRQSTPLDNYKSTIAKHNRSFRRKNY